MKYSEILEKLKEVGVTNTFTVMVATSCDSAYKAYRDELEYYGISYDDFCGTCEDIWMDCEEGTGLTTIADSVAEYICDHAGEKPERYVDII